MNPKLSISLMPLDTLLMVRNIGLAQIGIRFHGLITTPLRIDFAVGNEGWKLAFCGNAVF